MPDQVSRRVCRAARALAGWNQADLARAADVSKQTIVDFERGVRTPYRNNLRAIEAALASAGVEFTLDGDGQPGVRIAAPHGAGGAPPGSQGASVSLETMYRRVDQAVAPSAGQRKGRARS